MTTCWRSRLATTYRLVNPVGRPGGWETGWGPFWASVRVAPAARRIQPLARDSPAAAVAPPMTARRESPRRASCEDDSEPEPSGTGGCRGDDLMRIPFRKWWRLTITPRAG